MKKEYLAKFTDLITALAATFNREADEATFLGYEMALSDLSIEAVELAVQKAVRQCHFMPTGAELRELAGDVGPKERAVIAFGCVAETIKRHGYYDSVSFDDPLINAAIRNLGGWERVSLIEDHEEFDKWFRKEFERVYIALCRTGASAEACKPLMGHYDKANGHAGYEQKAPLRIATGLAPHGKDLVRLPQKKAGAKPIGIPLKIKKAGDA